LALAVNNWNNQGQLNNKNKLFLKKMLKNLEANKQRLNSIVYDTKELYIPSLEEATKARDSILKLSYLGLKAIHLNFIMSAPFFAANSLLNLNDTAYCELSNRDKFYTVGSEALANASTLYYKKGEREADYNLVNSQAVSEGFKKFQNGFGEMALDYKRAASNFNISHYLVYR
jgi:hypothetical protein